MIKLIDINEENWLDVRQLCINDDHQIFLDSSTGIIAMGYAYRNCNAEVIGIANDNQIIGVALVKDLDEKPACYDLQQFMIDKRFQNNGFGTAALKLIISKLQIEGKYNSIEVSVNRSNASALNVFAKAGFLDTGYIDDDTPDRLNLMYYFDNNQDGMDSYSDVLITDFLDPIFHSAFKQYFSELDISIRDWDGLFKEMNDEGGNLAFVRLAENKEVIGFIQFSTITFKSWFFEEAYGFIRELWVNEKYRNRNHGSQLIEFAEQYFCDHGIYSSILTADTEGQFYLKQGYVRVPGCKARNQDEVYVKRLK